MRLASRRGICDELKEDQVFEKFLVQCSPAMCQAPKIFLASDVDATVERVAAGSHAWAALGVEGRLRHLHTLRSKLSHADFAAWTVGSIHAQGLDPNSDLGRAQQVAEMMTMSAVAAGEQPCELALRLTSDREDFKLIALHVAEDAR